MIKVENLSMLFSTEEVQTKALNEVTFEIGKGEFVAIMGPSGCGKSTLLNILGTLDTPTSGSYLFEGKRVDKMNENQLTALRKGNIGFIFQSFNLIDELTVYENVELPLVYLNIKPTERNRRVKEVLRKSEYAASRQSSATTVIRWTAATCGHSPCRSNQCQAFAGG